MCWTCAKKSMGSRLRKLKASWVNKKLSDEKTIGGKGRLTEKKITSYYGNAIRDNPDRHPNMRQAVWAAWAHTCSSDKS